MAASIAALSSVTIGVHDLEQAVAFYTGPWALTEVAREPGTVYLRAAGTEPYVLCLKSAAERLIEARFRCHSRAAMLDLHAALAKAQVSDLTDPAALQTPGGGVGFAFTDDEGRRFVVCADLAMIATQAAANDRPVKISHLVLNSNDVDRSCAFFAEMLGFRLSDSTRMMSFMRCNTDHHSVAFARTGNVSLNHIAFEMPSWDGLMRGAGRMKESGHRMEWGLGRHGPGANVFAYYLDPEGMAVEYTAEVQQIVDEAAHHVGTPDEWVRPANRMDQWGYSDPPSQAMQNAMHGDSPH